MSDPLLQTVVFGLLAASGNLIGGLVLLPSGLKRWFKLYSRYFLAVGAGFMLAVTVLEILPKTVVIWQHRFPAGDQELLVPMVLLLAGYLLTQFLEHTIAPHFHLGEEVHTNDGITTRSAYTAVGGMVVHTFFDGVTISAASQVDPRIGVIVFLAVVLHKVPEGFTIGSMVLAAGKGARQVIVTTGIIGLMTLSGALAFQFVGSNIDSAVAYALPFAAGVTLYVAASDLIPEVNHHGGQRPVVTLAIICGVALYFGTHLAIHSAFGI